MGKLDGKVAVVTGGNSGIGLAAAQRFVEDGAYVFITGRRQEELDAAVRQIGRNVQAIRGDVSKLADLERIMATVKEQKGRIDVLFANAGIAEAAPLTEITEEFFDRHFDINVKGALFAVQKALPMLRGRGIDHLHVVGGGLEGVARRVGVQRDQGGAALARAHTHDRIEGTQDPRECGEPGHDRHARPAGPAQPRRAGPARALRGGDPAWPARAHRRDRERSSVSRIGREQLRDGHRIVRRWRYGAGLTTKSQQQELTHQTSSSRRRTSCASAASSACASKMIESLPLQRPLYLT